MSEINNHVILSYIDSPTRILLWSSDQVLVCLFPLAVGMIIDCISLGIVCSLIASFGHKMFKKKYGRGKTRSIMYWNLPTSKKLIGKGLPPSYVRIWIK